MAGPKLQEGVRIPGPGRKCEAPAWKLDACLANYDLMRSQDVALTFWAVNWWCLGACSRTPEPRDWLSSPQTLAQVGKGRLGGVGVGLDCQTDTRAHTPPSKAPLPPEQRKASF